MLFLFCHLKPHLKLKRNHAVFLWQLAFTIFQKYFFLVSKISLDLSCQKHSLNFIQIFIKWITQYFLLGLFLFFLRPYFCLKTWVLQFGMTVCDWKCLAGEEVMKRSSQLFPNPQSYQWRELMGRGRKGLWFEFYDQNNLHMVLEEIKTVALHIWFSL